jgi:hypothetical protein
MHVLSLPFGFALALLPRREARLVRNDKRPIHVLRGLDPRERLLSDAYAAAYRRPIA